MVVTADGYDDDAVAAAVHRHALKEVASDSWVQADLEGEPWNGKSAVFSPRIASPTAKDSQKQSPSTETIEARWRLLQSSRHDGIAQELRLSDSSVGVELIGALGEPAYWRFADVKQKEQRPDEGANRWEMKTRNRGEDFVHDRLRSLAKIVSDRNVVAVREGLLGAELRDEAYKGKRSEESRTPTGFTKPQFTDSALAWCALWGIALFPVVHRLTGPSVTAGALPLGRFTPKELVIPVLVGQYSLARWRVLIVSAQTHRVFSKESGTARAWLTAHGVRAVIRFPVFVSDNSSAPERYLRSGVLTVFDS